MFFPLIVKYSGEKETGKISHMEIHTSFKKETTELV